jgi:hypothetical protein
MDVLTKGDDFPIHQTPEPIAYSGTDRNFYDRYFFNGYSPDGETFFAVAFGVYPHLNIADAHFSVIRHGVQYNLHASRVLNMERMDLEVGPIRLVVEEPLQRLRIIVSDSNGMSADLVFEGRAFPIEEPRFIHRVGPRSFLDYTRLTQNGRYTGWFKVDADRYEVPAGFVGTRDRSWGVRPIGAGDQQPYIPAIAPGFFWQWTPLNFARRSIFYHVNETAQGIPWNRRAVIAPDGALADGFTETDDAVMTMEMLPGTRHARSALLTIQPKGEPALRIAFEPITRFQMSGIGYLNPNWNHGGYRGMLVVERDQYVLSDLDVNDPLYVHIEAICRVTCEQAGQPTEVGIGAFEQLILGPYAPLGFGDSADPSGVFARRAD